jgi:protein-tyrosine-phosphatase/predicted ATP-grasp superfamily ATP-dependent carboligase
MLKALVLDAFSRSAVETIQSLGRHGVEVHASAPENCLAFHSRRVHSRWEQPTTNEPRLFLEWLRRLDLEQGYSLIVPSTEYSLLALSKTAEEDVLRAKAQLPDSNALETAFDKWKTVVAAKACGIATPPTRLIESLSEVSAPESYPVVLKTARSLVRIGDEIIRMDSMLARDPIEWERFLRVLLPYTPVLEQPCLSGYGVGIEMLFRHGQLVWYFCHRRLHEGSGAGGLGSASWYRCSMEAPPDLLRQSTELMKRLCWHGVAMIEFLRASDGPYWLMEINPRLWGSVGLAIDAGVDFPWGLLLSATGQTLPPQPIYRVPYYARAIEEDARWMFGLARSKPLMGIRELVKVGRPVLGCESWDYFDWGDFGVAFAGTSQFLRQAGRSLQKRFRAASERRHARTLHQANVARIGPSRLTMRRLLFLCYGNICRSPFAEALARRLLPTLDICSAGFHPNSGRTSPVLFQACARSLGVDLTNHRSRSVSVEMVKSADIVLLMDFNNLEEFQHQYSDQLGKVLMLGMLVSPWSEIRDPYGTNVQQTIRVLEQAVAAIEGLTRWLETPS